MNIPPSTNDKVEPRGTKSKDRTKTGQDNKGIITNEIVSKDRTIIDIDSDGNNLEYNDSKRTSCSVSTHTRTLYLKAKSFNDLTGDESARHNGKCRKKTTCRKIFDVPHTTTSQ